ncbi:MAG: hypothetical protein WD276_02190 [Actinomycetota bacterium]
MAEATDFVDGALRSLGRPRDEDLAGMASSEAAQELLKEILLAPREEESSGDRHEVARRRRWQVAVAVAAAVAALVVALPLAGPQPPPALARPVQFFDQRDYFAAVVTDPSATAEELRNAFAARGFDIDVTLVPVSPSVVGRVLSIEEDPQAQTKPIKVLHGTGCITQGGGAQCPVGIRIPHDFVGHAVLDIGRAGLPGERYQMATTAYAPGESLHCSGLQGLTVAEASPIIESLGVRAVWRSGDPSIDDPRGVSPSLIADHIVTDASAISEGTVEIWARRSPDYPPGFEEWRRLLDEGC